MSAWIGPTFACHKTVKFYSEDTSTYSFLVTELEPIQMFHA